MHLRFKQTEKNRFQWKELAEMKDRAYIVLPMRQKYVRARRCCVNFKFIMIL